MTKTIEQHGNVSVYEPLLDYAIVYTDLYRGVFNQGTKDAAVRLCECGHPPVWVRVLSGGNIEQPSEVIKAADIFERNL